jgi:MarR family transcriptional regulator, lower aerobic nicotinate degradation pathway regulator
MNGVERRDAAEEEGRRIQAAVTRIVRWAGRSDVRRRLLGAAGRGLSAVDVNVLRTVVASGPLRISELAEWQGVDKSTMTPQVRRLEERGLVERQLDPQDRRGVLVRATPRGRRVRSRMDAEGAAVFDNILRDWSLADRTVLADLLERFARELGEQPIGRTPPSGGPAS